MFSQVVPRFVEMNEPAKIISPSAEHASESNEPSKPAGAQDAPESTEIYVGARLPPTIIVLPSAEQATAPQ
jgi:hypothetical protein